MRMRIPLVVVLALFVAVSCDQKLVEPATEQVAEAPAFDWTNNPDNGNIKVYRDEFAWIECWSDTDNGLRACHGTIPLGGNNPEPDCGLQQAEAPASYQDVGFLQPDLFDNVLKVNVQGDVWITIRDLNMAGDCFGAALVAEGWGKLKFNDNDTFGPGSPGENANSWGPKSQGKVTAVDGSSLTYNGHVHFIENDQKFQVTSSKVDLH